MLRINEGLMFDDREIEERFVRAAGPGGQNVKHEETAVEVRIDTRRSSLPPTVTRRLIALAGRNITSDGVLVLVARGHRSQSQNRDAVRARLVGLLQRAASVPKPRKPTRPRAAVRERRLTAKRSRSAVKQSRSRPRRD